MEETSTSDTTTQGPNEANELEEVQKVPDTSIEAEVRLKNIIINSSDEISNQEALVGVDFPSGDSTNGVVDENVNDNNNRKNIDGKMTVALGICDENKEVSKVFNEEEKENELVKNGLIGKGDEEVIDGFSFVSFDSEIDLKALFEIRKRELNLLLRGSASVQERPKKTPSKVKKEKGEFSRQKSTSSSSTTSNGASDSSGYSKIKQETTTTSTGTAKKEKKAKKLTNNSQSGSSNTNSNSSFISNDDEVTNDNETTSNLNDSNVNSETIRHEATTRNEQQTQPATIVDTKSELSLKPKHENGSPFAEFSTNSPKSKQPVNSKKSNHESLIAETEAATHRAAMASLANANYCLNSGNYPFFPGGPSLPQPPPGTGTKFNPFMMMPGMNNLQQQQQNMMGQFPFPTGPNNADHMAMMQKFMEIQNQQEQANALNQHFPPVNPLLKQQHSQFLYNHQQQQPQIPAPQSPAELALITALLSGDPSINPANLPPHLQQIIHNISQSNNKFNDSLNKNNNTSKTNQHSFVDTNQSNPNNSASGSFKPKNQSYSKNSGSNPPISPSTNNLKNSLPSPLGFHRPNHSLPHSLHLPSSSSSPKFSPSPQQQQAAFSLHPGSNPLFTSNPNDQHHFLPSKENSYHQQLQQQQFLKNVNQASSANSPSFVSPKQQQQQQSSKLLAKDFTKTPSSKAYQHPHQQQHHHTSNNHTSNSHNPSSSKPSVPTHSLNGQLFKPPAHLNSTSCNSSTKQSNHSAVDMFGTSATNSPKLPGGGHMSVNHLLTSPKQQHQRDLTNNNNNSLSATSPLPFNFAQMVGSHSNGMAGGGGFPGFPPFGFDPSNPLNSADFLRQELNSRFLQNLTSAPGASQSASPLGMLPPPMSFGTSPFPMLPPGLANLSKPGEDPLKQSDKNSSKNNTNSNLDSMKLLNEQQHQMMMMQQFFRNSLPGLLPPSMAPSSQLPPPPPMFQAQPKQHASSPSPSRNNSINSKENNSHMPQPSFSSNNVNSHSRSSRPDLGLPPHHHHQQQQQQNPMPSFSPFNNKNLNSLKIQANQKNPNYNNNQQISPSGNNKSGSKWSTAHIKIAHMIMSHQSQKHIDKQQLQHRPVIPTSHASNHLFQPFKPSTSLPPSSSNNNNNNNNNNFNNANIIKTKPKQSHHHPDFPIQPSFHPNNKVINNNSLGSLSSHKTSTTASASTFYPPIQSPITNSSNNSSSTLPSTAPAAYGGLASLDTSNKPKFNLSPDLMSSHFNQGHSGKTSKKAHHHHHGNEKSSRDSSKSRQRSRSRSPVSSKSSKHNSRGMQQPANNQQMPSFPLGSADSMIPQNPLATEAAITAYAQLMMADKHRQDLLRLSAPGSNGKVPPNLMPMMSPFLPGLPPLGSLPPAPGAHYPLNLPPLSTQQMPAFNSNQAPMVNAKNSQKSPPVLSPRSFQAMLMQTMPQNLNETEFLRMIASMQQQQQFAGGKSTPEPLNSNSSSAKKDQNQQAINSHNQFLQQFFENVNERANLTYSTSNKRPDLSSPTGKSKKTERSDSVHSDSGLEEPKSKKAKRDLSGSWSTSVSAEDKRGGEEDDGKAGEDTERAADSTRSEAKDEEKEGRDENKLEIAENEVTEEAENRVDDEENEELEEEKVEEVHDNNSRDTEVIERDDEIGGGCDEEEEKTEVEEEACDEGMVGESREDGLERVTEDEGTGVDE